jgi:glycosyltransferase involved in cell wall biosynthesis
MLEMKARGWEVVGAGAGGDGYEKAIRDLGVRFIELPVDRRALNPLADLRLLWALWRLYREERPAVVHHFTIKPVIYGSIAARLAGVHRIVNTVTGLGYVFSGAKERWLRSLVELQYKIALRCAHYTFFQNTDDRDLFVRRGLVPAARVGLLAGSGVDLDQFRPMEPRADRSLQVLMIARLLRDKGIYEYVEAARLLRAEFPAVTFSILGGRDERNPTVVALADIEAWKRQGWITWHGEVADVRDYLAAADIVVLPSYREGTPRSLLEAAAMARPIVTTDITGCREVVDDGYNGLLVPVKDVMALAAAIRCLLRDAPLRHQMGLAGREKMCSQFDERSVIARIVEAYAAPTGRRASG